MFTGIIEATGVISSVSEKGTNKTFQVISSLSPELKADQSVSHDGVCLTVESVTEHTYQVTAIEETLSKSCLFQWRPGSRINLERCLQINGRLGVSSSKCCAMLSSARGLLNSSIPLVCENMPRRRSFASDGSQRRCGRDDP